MNLKLKLLIFLTVLLLSCKNESKKTEIKNDKNEISQSNAHKDAEIEKALNEGIFIKNNEGYDITIIGNTIYFLNSNPSEDEKNNHFFIEVTRDNIKSPTKDILPQDILFSDSLSNNFSNVGVYKYTIQEFDAPFNILVGQFNNTDRTWFTFVHANQMSGNEVGYKNEYLKNVKSNRYLKDFEEAFNEGYFMQSQEHFDLLLDDHTLYYIKPKGKDSDLQERFFLHVIYEDNERKVIDFDPVNHQINNLLGDKYKNFIVLKKEIPSSKKIKEIGTGQFKNDLQFWSIVYQIDKLYDNMAFIYDDQYREIISSNN